MPGQDKPIILVVDDQPVNLKMLGMVLQGEYRVRAARSGAEALDALQAPPLPDLILLDIMMPEMDGFTTLRNIRAAGHTQIPVIFVTALTDEINEHQGLLLGAADYITKPIKAPIVLARIRTQLALKAAREHLEQRVQERTRELEQKHQELRQTYIETVRSFSIMLERREPVLAGHAKRVADSARRIARKLDLDEKTCNDIVFAGLLSRIGTLNLPTKLLTRPQVALTSEEMGEIMISTLSARQIFGNIPPLAEAANIIANQFERHDGSGFPNHLIGEKIPIGARILSVARDFDLFLEGMINASKHSVPEGRQYLSRKSGAHYDPEIVRIHNDMVGKAIKPRLPTVEVGLIDVVVGMELAEVRFADEVFVRDTTATRELIDELEQIMLETGIYCAVKVKLHPL